MTRCFYLNHSPIDGIHFIKNSNNFVVKELPLYEFSGEGEHLVLHVRKKDLTTWQMLQDLSRHCGAKMRDFGYAGLKDKDGMTTQYVSIHKSFEKKIANFDHDKIKILSITRHNNKIKIGHLKGNRFFIRLKKVLPTDALKLKEAIGKIDKEGFPNYFGSQRFGMNRDNYEQGLRVLKGELRGVDRKRKHFLTSAFQSKLFNDWLSKRVEISKFAQSFNQKELVDALGFNSDECKEILAQKSFMKILKGDVCHHYPHGKAYICEDIAIESERFKNREIVPTGWLPGSKAIRADYLAKKIEDEYFAPSHSFLDQMSGSRRFAWSFAEDVEWKYREDEAWFEINFSLQKGSYATVLLEEILRKELSAI